MSDKGIRFLVTSDGYIAGSVRVIEADGYEHGLYQRTERAEPVAFALSAEHADRRVAQVRRCARELGPCDRDRVHDPRRLTERDLAHLVLCAAHRAEVKDAMADGEAERAALDEARALRAASGS